MSKGRPLRGSCNCGRNVYEIAAPNTAADAEAQVYFDDSSHFRRAQATPLTAWLRVPIEWVSSTTIAQLPNESHADIRRTFVPPEDPNCKRIFCGFCGTHLSYWTEEPAVEANYLSVTLGSLIGEDLRALRELNLLPEESSLHSPGRNVTTTDGAVGSSQLANTAQQASTTQRHTRTGRLGDLDWFEEMIHGSELGRTQKTRRGIGVSADGSTQVSWAHVTEIVEGDDSGTSTSNAAGSKRKIEDIAGDDIVMK